MLSYTLLVLSFLGLVIAFYAYTLHLKILQNSFYKPFCDISNLISCTRTIKSPYSTFLGFPLAMYGVVFYALLFVLVLFNADKVVLFLALAASVLSVFLAAFSYLKLNVICPLCWALYVVNFLLLFNSLY